MDSHSLIGTELGPCAIVQLLGQGSTGAVFLADHAELREQVAVKVVAPPASPLEPLDLASFLARFRRAASRAATLAHPHILPVIEYGVQDGLGYLVMPYLGLESLEGVMSRGGPVAPQVAADYLDQVASALTYAHARGILHGNITPRNILLRRGGTLVLTDFGQGLALRPPIRQTGNVAQAARVSAYRAPEQLLGGRVDERTDLYALGALLFELLTGTTPYSGTSASELLMQQLQQPPPSPQEVLHDVRDACALVIVRALAREPSHRFARIEELASAFRLAITVDHQALAQASAQASAPSLPQEVPALLAAPPEKRTVGEPGHGLAAATASLTPTALLHAAPPLPPTLLDAQKSAQDAEALPVLAGREDSEEADERGSGSANTGLIQVLTAVTEERQETPVPRERAATAVPIRSEDDRRQNAPAFPLPAARGALLPRVDLHRIAKLPWPIRRRGFRWGRRRGTRFLAVCAACLLVVVVAGSLLWGSLSVQQKPDARKPHAGALPGQATLFSDPLTRASHSQWWPTVPASVYTFTQDGYRISSASLEGTSAVLVTPLWQSPITYSITARAVSGIDSATFFGILFRCNSQDEEGSPQACYSFEATFGGAGAYRFYKYDALTFAERQAGPASEWSLLWQHPIGQEFHGGRDSSNTFSVVEEQQTFTLLLNGKRVGQVGDASYHSGMIGIIVGGPGAVVAFSRLSVTRT